MHTERLQAWQHGHAFGANAGVEGERRTRWVVGITLVMMVGEIAAGTAFRSMALLADGWHMGTHAAALGVALFAYAYARKHAGDPRYSFGTGKVGALGGFASAVGLAVVALLVLGESVTRLASPVAIQFDEAIAVAVLGLAVNLGCALLLREDHGHGHGHDERHDHDEHHDDEHHDHGAHPDHNRRAAYLHVLADALTSVLAIVALLAGRSLGWTWMDPAMGVVGSLVIARWSVGLLRDTSAVLLDAEVQAARRRAIAAAIETDGDDRVADLHVWRVGPRHLAVIVSVVTHAPREPAYYRGLLGGFPDLAHVTVEVNGCADDRRAVAGG
ncbi:CDF family Co(II)/Ni(II) efflux transporter DmeF [Anaeromyxobacter oryzae]|uniref:Cation efflux system protein n=1 Tax=Anaeromyxobacter oryzae TaxID=2918170 RepID=A0ABN6MQC1_9BACT|nr:CDF family Co(II)/Ni(II) efflux transporter DmeF [Anaeromyxobacter oryzae]BDG03173.1 cation efflux system protein [Anaeromyxobacter oryzae]